MSNKLWTVKEQGADFGLAHIEGSEDAAQKHFKRIGAKWRKRDEAVDVTIEGSDVVIVELDGSSHHVGVTGVDGRRMRVIVEWLT